MPAIIAVGGIVYLGSILALRTNARSTATIVVGAMLIVMLVAYWQRICRPALIAAIIALAVSSIYSHIYNPSSIYLGRIDLFPLVMWTSGLLAVYESSLRVRPFSSQLVNGLVVYFAGLFLLEYLGYYLLSIRNIPLYPSLFGLGIIHGPPIIHVLYLAAGPLYLAVMSFMQPRSSDAAE